MLRHLRVTNFAILSDVSLDFSEGFNVLTGETGAGKSLIVEAVSLLRGGRASADIPRTGASEAVVEAIFEVPDDLRERVATMLAEAGLPAEDDVLVRRVIQRGGRSRTYVNGALTTASRLASLGAVLVDLSGQHQHQGLVDPKRHLAILDAFAGHAELVDEMATAHQRLRDAETAIAALAGDAGSIEDRVDYLRFQLDELDAANPIIGEDEQLEQERARLLSVDQLLGAARRAEALTYADDAAAVDRLATAAHELERVAELDPRLAEPHNQIEEARALAEDAASALRTYADELDADPERLSELDDRLDLLARLKRKHSGTLASMLAHADELRAELDRLTHRDSELAELELTHKTARANAEAVARRLTTSRKRAAKRLAKHTGEALSELGMKSATLSVTLAQGALGVRGADKIDVALAANIGEQAKPLAKVASGGELSRIMLALKLVLRRADEVATYVFDEVDAGIGGATAEVVGRQIRAVADSRQVLCVTHLPQIAAFAVTHFHVAKTTIGDRTETTVTRLDAGARRDEISRMLGGARITKKALAHADEMLQAARSS